MLSKIACLRHSSGDLSGFDSQTSQASKPIRGQIMDYRFRISLTPFDFPE